MNENKDFKSFKRWCKLKGLKPGIATSLQLYMKKKNTKENIKNKQMFEMNYTKMLKYKER